MRRWIALLMALLLMSTSCSRYGDEESGDEQPTRIATTTTAVSGRDPTNEPAQPASGLEALVADPETRESVDGVLADAVALGFTGVVARLDSDGRPVGVPVGDPPTESPVEDPTDLVFALGSITKNITAAAIVLASEQGLIDLDQPIGDYLDGVPEDKSAITIDQLLTHTSGLGNATVDESDPIARTEMVERILALPLVADPGQGLNYSDAGYTLTAAILEAVTGVDHQSWITEMLLDPASMDRTGWIGDGSLGVQGVTMGPSDAPQQRSLTELGRKGWGVFGAGGMYSTAGDMLAFVSNLPEVLGAEGLETYTSAHFSEPDADESEGYGWVILEFGPDEVELNNTGGEAEVGQTFTVFWPRPSDDVLVIASSSTSFPSGRLIGDLIAVLVDGDPYERDPVLASAQALDDAEKDSIAGSYETAQGEVIELTAQGSVFELTSPNAQIYDRVFTGAELSDRSQAVRDAAEAWLLADPEDLVDDEPIDAISHFATGPVPGGELRSWFSVPIDSEVILAELLVTEDGVLEHISVPGRPPGIRLVASSPTLLTVATFQPELVQLERIDVDDSSLTLHLSDGTNINATRIE